MRDKPQTKRQMVDDARRAALEGRWTEAIQMNQHLIERSPKDAEAHNRLGRALVALQRFGPAIEAYSNALRSDPANMIARRNLQRLDLLRHRPHPEESDEDGNGASAGTTASRPAVFIEEIGKTWVDELVNPSPMEDLVGVTSGQQLQLEVADGRLYVTAEDSKRLGEIEAKTAERVISLIEGGNRYEVYALGITTQSLRVILREVYHDPAHGTRLSFPRQIKSRAYLRERDLLRQRDEADFFMLDDEDDEDDEEEPTAEAADEEDAPEPDAEPFIDETVTVEEEEQTI